MDVYFYLSSDVQYNVMVKIHCVAGLPAVNILEQDSSLHYSPTTCSDSYECFIEASLYQKGMVVGLPVCGSYKQFSCASGTCSWDEWLQFPVRFCDVSREAQIAFTLYSVSPIVHSKQPNIETKNRIDEYNSSHADWVRLKSTVIGGVTLPLFEQRILRYGRHKLRLKEKCAGDGSIDSQTLFSNLNPQLTVTDNLEAVLTMKLMRKIPQVPWLDALTNRRLLKISGVNHKNKNKHEHKPLSKSRDEDSSGGVYLYVDLPNLGYHVVYQEKAKGKKLRIEKEESSIESQLLVLHDPEMKLCNPVLEKNKKLSKHLLYGSYDARPTGDEVVKLEKILQSFQVDTDVFDEGEKELLWKFRKYLMNDKRALTKFLGIIDQSSNEEVNIALDLMADWVDIDVANALELLSGHFVNSSFRNYGIDVLRKSASDADLELYIMQLVQAIRFENDKHSHLSELARFLLDRSLSSDSFRLFNFLYWSVEVASKSENEDEAASYSYFLTKIESDSEQKRYDFYVEIQRQKWFVNKLIELSQIVDAVKGRAEDKKKVLRNLLRFKGKFAYLQNFENPPIMPLRPEIRVTGIDPEKCSVFRSAMCPLLLTFKMQKNKSEMNNNNEIETGNNNNIEIEGETKSDNINDSKSDDVDHNNVEYKENNKNNNDLLEEKVQTKDTKRKRSQLVDTERDEYYRIIWKNGDDLRQDQLIIQMINLMDNLLRDVNLDLNLTPYPVLATGVDHGMIEFVPESSAIAKVLKDYNDNISLFLESNTNGKQNKLKKIVDTFVRSCSGYCVITFLLGVGDRHLDNLLITKQGHLFHIDFGFIYGDDPKPWPPPMKICKQMIDAMGGYNSPQYKEFQEHMTSCYSRLRKKAPLILNLLSLMGQGSIQEITKNVNFVHGKFRLDLTSEQASAYLLNLAEESVNALFTKVVDRIHDWATYWR